MSIENSVKQIIEEQLGCKTESVRTEASLRDDLMADSMDLNNIWMELEEQFKIEIPPSDAEKLDTVKDVIEYIKKRL
jgi:acyl carrier protein